MGFLDPKPQTTAGLDAAVTAKINDGASATKAALNATYAPKASPTFTGTVSGVTKSMVGLGSVDNTADTAKPVSTAQATAIAAKLDTTAAATTYVKFVDLAGNPISARHVTIKVDTSTWEIADIIAEA